MLDGFDDALERLVDESLELEGTFLDAVAALGIVEIVVAARGELEVHVVEGAADIEAETHGHGGIGNGEVVVEIEVSIDIMPSSHDSLVLTKTYAEGVEVNFVL